MESGETVHGRYAIRTFSSGTKVSARAFATGSLWRLLTVNQWTPRLAPFSLLDERDIQERDAWQDGIPTAREGAKAQ